MPLKPALPRSVLCPSRTPCLFFRPVSKLSLFLRGFQSFDHLGLAWLHQKGRREKGERERGERRERGRKAQREKLGFSFFRLHGRFEMDMNKVLCYVCKCVSYFFKKVEKPEGQFERH